MRYFFVLTFFFSLNLLFSQGKVTINTPEGFNTLIQKRVDLYKLESRLEKIGYRIQLFNGKSRQKAIDIKYNFNKYFPGIDADIIFETPEWKTVAGYYGEWNRANRAKVMIKSKFPNAFIRRMKFKRIKLFEGSI